MKQIFKEECKSELKTLIKEESEYRETKYLNFKELVLRAAWRASCYASKEEQELLEFLTELAMEKTTYYLYKK